MIDLKGRHFAAAPPDEKRQAATDLKVAGNWRELPSHSKLTVASQSQEGLTVASQSQEGLTVASQSQEGLTVASQSELVEPQ